MALTAEQKKNIVKDKLIGGMTVKDIKDKYGLKQNVNTLTTLARKYIGTVVRAQREKLEQLIDDTAIR